MPGSDLHSAWSPHELNDVRAILLDIEGTTTPIEYVHHVLFPYARARVKSFLREHAADPDVRADIDSLHEAYDADAESHRDIPSWDPVAYVSWLMDRDSKSTGLKSLQGRIWEAGYTSGELRGQARVYPDVQPALERWRRQGKEIAIFSSGSIQAQRNLFANTTVGDLSPLLAAYFDTATGPKREPESYRRIATRLGHPPRAVLFISDVVAELDAARDAGMRTALCVRSGHGAPQSAAHPLIRSFDELA